MPEDPQAALNPAAASPSAESTPAPSTPAAAPATQSQPGGDSQGGSTGGGASAPAAAPTTTAAAGAEPGPVPYARFKEINDRLKELETWNPVVDALRQQYQSPDELQRAYEAQETQRIEEARRQQLLVQQRQALASDINNRVLAGLITPEEGQAEWGERARAIENQAHTQSRLATLEAEALSHRVAAALAKYPSADADTVRTLAQNGQDAMAAAKKSHERFEQLKGKAIADYNVQKASVPPAPEGGGGAVASSNGVMAILADPDHPDFDKTWAAEKKAAQRRQAGY